jgi:ATP-dependent DNA helicase PIF1
MLLAQRNAHPFDARIQLTDKHVYILDNSSKDMVSCTTFNGRFFKPFIKTDAIANIIKSDKYLNDPEYKYYQKSTEVIEAEWDFSNKAGTQLHNEIENFLNKVAVSNDSKEYGFFQSFLKDHKDYTPFRTEWIIFAETLRIAGSIDAVFKDPHGNYVIFDWKRSVVTYSDFENAKYPLEHFKDNTFVKYSLQLNMYRHILETFYGIKIKSMFIIELHPDNNSYKKIEVDRWEKEMGDLFALRAEELKKKGYKDSALNQYVFSNNLITTSSSSSKKDKPANKGKRWTDEEDNRLLDSIKAGKSRAEIAVEHERTENAIFLRILRNAAILLEKKKPIDLVCEIFKLTFKELNDYCEGQISKQRKVDPKASFADAIENLKYDPSSPSSTSSAEILEEIKPLKKKKIIVLSDKQKQCLLMMKEGKNIFLTGQAGTGKSLVISTFVKEYENKKIIAVTATTGTAAVLLNGTTLFSYLGIGLGNVAPDLLIIQLRKKKFFLKRWIDLDVLIIDEVSMLSPELFDKLELVARSIRHSTQPFGGIQLILTGDFFQLPNINQKDMFCFDAESWGACIGDNVINLNTNFRQQEDDVYQKCLDDVRCGVLRDETIRILKSRENVVLKNDYGIQPTKIYSLNVNVDEENEIQLDKLDDGNIEFREYELNYELFKKVTMVAEKIKKGCNAPQVVQLCKGAQVMLLYNMDLESKLVNGSRGIVTGFDSENNPIVKFLTGAVRVIPPKNWEIEENGEIAINVSQIPLKLAYATTVHRSQGATIDYAEVDMEGIFEYGQAYVALSRVKSLAGLSIKHFNPDVIKAHPKVVEFYKKY